MLIFFFKKRNLNPPQLTLQAAAYKNTQAHSEAITSHLLLALIFGMPCCEWKGVSFLPAAHTALQKQ